MVSDDVYRMLVDSAPFGVVLCDPAGTVLHLSPEALRILRREGSDPDALPGTPIHDSPGVANPAFTGAWNEVANGAPGTRRVVPALPAWGDKQVVMARLPDAVVLYLPPHHPDPERVEEEQRYERQARDFAAFRASYPYGSVAVFDADLRYESVSGRGWAEIGVDPESLEGSTFEELWDRPTAEALTELARLALDGREACRRIRHDEHVWEIWAGPLEASGRAPRGMFLSRDVTDEVLGLERIQLLRAALDGARTGVLLVDLSREDEPIIYANRGFLDLTGYRADEVLGRNCRFLQGPGTDPEQVRAMRTAIDRRKSFADTVLNYRKDGSTFWNFVSFNPIALEGGAPTHYVGIQEDVTDIRRQSRKQEHQSRLAELGTLAGTIAHDFNNILMVVNGRAELLADQVSHPEAQEELEAIREGLQRGAQLTAQLLAYGRDRTDRAGASSDPVASARHMVPAVVRLLPERVRVETDVPDEEVLLGLPTVELEQILLNLAKNASDAMPDGGTLSLAVESEVEDMVRIRVSDTGPGIPTDVRDRIFEPFFTTKGDDGTGLGLSTVRKLVERAGGSVRVESSAGSGTTFELRLPRAASPELSSDRVPERHTDGAVGDSGGP